MYLQRRASHGGESGNEPLNNPISNGKRKFSVVLCNLLRFIFAVPAKHLITSHTCAVEWFGNEDVQFLRAQHNGSVICQGSPLHKRERILSSQELRVIDLVTFSNVQSGLNLFIANRKSAPHSIPVMNWSHSPRMWRSLKPNRLRTPSGNELTWFAEGGEVKISNALWYPQFRIVIPTRRISICRQINGYAGLKFVLRWAAKINLAD